MNRSLVIAALAALAAVACEHPHRDAVPVGYVELNPFAPVGPPAEAALLPLLAEPEPLDAERQRLLDRVLEDPAGFLAGPPPVAVLNEAELVFFAAGRSFELADLYLEQVERDGVGAPLRSRLAWLYQRLGQETAALRVSEQAVRERPRDPQAVFVHAFVRGQRETASEALIAEVLAGYERVLELDPAFVGPGGVTANDLRAQVDQFRQAL